MLLLLTGSSGMSCKLVLCATSTLAKTPATAPIIKIVKGSAVTPMPRGVLLLEPSAAGEKMIREGEYSCALLVDFDLRR